MKWWFYPLFALVLFSCSEKREKQKKQMHEQTIYPGFFNLASMYSDEERVVSFPHWFNDSIVKARKIRTIRREVIDDPLIDTTETGALLPKKVYTYEFDKEGNPSAMLIETFYDNKRIGSVKTLFKKRIGDFYVTAVSDQMGYEPGDYPLVQYKLVQSYPEWACYQNIESMNLMCVIHDEAMWKPMTIDTLCFPDPDDVVLLGSLKSPVKRYHVTDIVKESKVKNYTYDQGVLDGVNWTEEPFTYKRTPVFNKNGICTGFIDSTYSLDAFVSEVVFDFKLNEIFPTEVTKSVRNGSDKRILLVETFTYTFYP